MNRLSRLRLFVALGSFLLIAYPTDPVQAADLPNVKCVLTQLSTWIQDHLGPGPAGSGETQTDLREDSGPAEGDDEGAGDSDGDGESNS